MVQDMSWGHKDRTAQIRALGVGLAGEARAGAGLAADPSAVGHRWILRSGIHMGLRLLFLWWQMTSRCGRGFLRKRAGHPLLHVRC